MSLTNNVANRPQYSCPACLKWFPSDTAIVMHAHNRQKYFCSTTCQNKWQLEQKNIEAL